jgi:MinD-like ATPase involved in chromosome partitioning or flagellar assembly
MIRKRKERSAKIRQSYKTLKFYIRDEKKFESMAKQGRIIAVGGANIHFARKLKFLKALKNLEADDIILDLGGDTSYNVLDFFLAADHQLVITVFVQNPPIHSCQLHEILAILRVWQ